MYFLIQILISESERSKPGLNPRAFETSNQCHSSVISFQRCVSAFGVEGK
jgi:hypothetical protein